MSSKLLGFFILKRDRLIIFDTNNLVEINNKLTKNERVSRKSVIDRLFLEGKSFVVYPLRVVYLVNVPEQIAEQAIMVSVSKKKFKRAVKRNYIKRRVKEAYRLQKGGVILPEGVSNVSIAFLYLSNELKSFDQLFAKMEEVIVQLNNKLCSEELL